MGVWTHVAGVIRFDSFTNKEPDVGIACSYDDEENMWNSCNIPCGSEGSLQISIWTSPSKASIAKYTVSIFGDLRDYDSEQEIIEYFDRITKNEVVRQATFTIKTNDNKTRTFVWKNESRNYGFKEIHDCGFVEVF